MPSLLAFPALAVALWLQEPPEAAPAPGEASEAEAAEGLADAPAEPSSPPSDPLEAPEPPAGRPLERGLAALEELDVSAAQEHLEEAVRQGPYRLEECVSLYSALGVARAYQGDEDGARQAFEQLLAIRPTYALAYTTSPKATFLFEEVRTRYQTKRATELRVTPPAVVPFGTPVVVEVTRQGDPLELIRDVEVRYRLKGNKTFESRKLAAPAVGASTRLELPPLTEADAFTDEQGQVGALYEIAVSGYDERGWEVFVGPSEERPLEVPVGFDAPGPWYTRWWVWALGGAGVAVATAAVATVTGAGAAAVFLWPAPETVPATPVVQSARPAGGHP